MHLVVISPEHDHPHEFAVLGELFAAGLERYHVRKPHAPAAQLEAWLRRVPAEWRSRLVLHQHHELVDALGLGGRHWRDDGTMHEVGRGVPAEPWRAASATAQPEASPYPGFTSRSCHDLPTLRAALGNYDSVFFGPVFPSISKPGHGPRPDLSHPEISSVLANRTAAQRRTAILALGGITADTAPRALALGFDGVAVLGAIWEAADPVRAFQAVGASLLATPSQKSASKLAPPISTPPLTPSLPHSLTPSLMCLTQDGLPLSHVEQAERLCAAGARWIQLRMKNAAAGTWLATAREVVAICRAHGAVCIVNDSVDIALAADADGVHLGRLDLDWREARMRLGAQRILGGTVNDSGDAQRAVDCGCLDYAGVGPLRFTSTKQKLAPVLGLEGVRGLIAQLGNVPAWVIGGVEAADLPALRAAGAAGAAVSGALFRDGTVEENTRALLAAWGDAGSAPVRPATGTAVPPAPLPIS
jgi:thiamine-phosphate pyrophosphorylase